jgi:hypothetical protein
MDQFIQVLFNMLSTHIYDKYEINWSSVKDSQNLSQSIFDDLDKENIKQ